MRFLRLYIAVGAILLAQGALTNKRRESLAASMALGGSDATDGAHYRCQPVGACQPCTDDELADHGLTYCASTGNKQAVSCQWVDGVPNDKQASPTLPTFQPCDHVQSASRWAFFRFQFLNVFMAVLACMTLIWRRRVLKLQKHRRMSQRMGRT